MIDTGPDVPDPRDARGRPGAAGLRLPARQRRPDRRDRAHARPRGPRRRPAVGAARAGSASPGLRRPADDRDGALEDRGAQAEERADARHRAGRAVRRGPVRPGDDPRVPLDSGRVRRGRDVRPGHGDHDRRLQVRPDAGGRPADRCGAAGGARQGGSAASVRRLHQRRPAWHRAVGGERRTGPAGGDRARAGPGGGDVVRIQRAPAPAGDRRRDRARPPGRRGGPLDAQEPEHRAPARPCRGARGTAGVAQGDRELPGAAAGDADDRQPGRAAVGAAPHGARRAPQREAALRRHDHLLRHPDPRQRARGQRDGRPPLPDRRHRDHDAGRRRARVRPRLVGGDPADAEPHPARST